MTTVLFLGVTGYIGGSVFSALRENYSDVTIRALVRSESAFQALENLNVTPVKGTFLDHDLITDLSSQSDIVINAADSDDVGLNTAILKGFKQRKDQGRGIGSLIHTSGTAIFIDSNKEGKYDPDGKVWTDSEEDIRNLVPTMLHGQVDVPILKASEEGYVNSFIVCPSAVCGLGSGPFKRMSSFLADLYVQRKEAWYLGEGTNVFGHVHIKDLIPVYLIALQTAIASNSKLLASSPYTRYYIANTAFIDSKTTTKYMAEVLYKKGLVKTPEAVQIPYEEAGPYAFIWSSNMSFRAERAASLGWKPKYEITKEVLTEGIDELL